MLRRIEFKLFVFIIVCLVYGVGSSYYLQSTQRSRTEHAVKQMRDADVQEQIMTEHSTLNTAFYVGWLGVGGIGYLLLRGELQRMWNSRLAAIALLSISMTGCGGGCNGKPFEPVKLETIDSNEEAFLIPLTGDGKEQQASDNETYLKKNLVYTKQIKIPQQWVKTGYEVLLYSGEWRDAAKLIKVDIHPITREWTADSATGTSSRNEAIWVMTSDQVEFSTGWTITARIATQDDAIKFLHNYKNGSLTQTTDTEIRSKLQAEFGIEVTDLPMDELRKNAVPHIQKVVNKVIEFFKPRGISITNLGITGGFVYKDKSIMDTLVKVFNAEQQKAIATAEKNAQEERNHTVIFESQGKADALMKTKKAESDAIKLIADAKSYEMQKAKEDLKTYMELKRLELQSELLKKWNGEYPKWFFGGGNGSTPNTLLQLPQSDKP